MKKTMIINNLKKYLLLTTVACFLVPGVSLAAPAKQVPNLKSVAAPTAQKPDLAVSIKIDRIWAMRGGTPEGSYDYVIKGCVKNVGSGDFFTRHNQIQLHLIEGRSKTINRYDVYGTLRRGQKMCFTQLINNAYANKSVPSYTMALVFDNDIYNDGNTANDDSNRNNNKATLSRDTIVRAMNAASLRASGNAHKNIKPTQKYQPQYKFKP